MNSSSNKSNQRLHTLQLLHTIHNAAESENNRDVTTVSSWSTIIAHQLNTSTINNCRATFKQQPNAMTQNHNVYFCCWCVWLTPSGPINQAEHGSRFGIALFRYLPINFLWRTSTIRVLWNWNVYHLKWINKMCEK